MHLSAISYKVRPGHEDEIAEIFSPRNFRRVDRSDVRDAAGQQTARLTATGLFIAGDIMVRVIQHDGDLSEVARHMSRQEGMREAERRLAPYLREPRDTATPEAFLSHFDSSTMRRLQLRVANDRVAVRLAAMRHRIVPGSQDAIARVFAGVRPAARPALSDERGRERGAIDAVALFAQDDTLIRVVAYEGELDDVARFMEQWSARGSLERELEPYMADGPAEPGADFRTAWYRHNMRQISFLSLATFRPHPVSTQR